jgi:hypothetical protein
MPKKWLLVVMAVAVGVMAFWTATRDSGTGPVARAADAIAAALGYAREAPDATCIQGRCEIGANSVPDEQARSRVLQLIDIQALGAAPATKPSFEIDGEFRSNAEAGDSLALRMHYAVEGLEPPIVESGSNESVDATRFDLWMILYPIDAPTTGVGKKAASDANQR